jgi:LPXTG-motif cell wall-anchored protein
MKLRRILPIILSLAMIVALIPAMVIGAADPEIAVGTVFSPVALGNNKLSDDNFALAAFKDGAKVALAETPDFYEWAGREGDKYKYYMLDGEEKYYVVRGPETPASDYKFMFTPNKNAGAVVIFTAPVSGTYSLEGLFNKEYPLQDGKYTTAVTIAAYKNGTGAALASVTSSADPENAQPGEVLALNVASVELKAGETLYVVCVPAAEGFSEWGPSSNTEVDKLDITLTAKAAAEPTPKPNPDTSDNLVIAIIGLLLASAGVVIASKKRR